MGTGWEGPISDGVPAETDEEDAVALLRDAVVGGVGLVDVNPVAEPGIAAAGPLLVALKPLQVLLPGNVARGGELGELHLEFDILDVVGEGGPQKSADVLENESSGSDLGNGPDGLGKHVAGVVHASRLAAHGEGLAGWAARHEIDPSVTPEIDLPHVSAVDGAASEGWVTHPLVVKQGFHRRRIPFVKRLVTEASGMEPEREPTSSREKFDGLELLHGFT